MSATDSGQLWNMQLMQIRCTCHFRIFFSFNKRDQFDRHEGVVKCRLADVTTTENGWHMMTMVVRAKRSGAAPRFVWYAGLVHRWNQPQEWHSRSAMRVVDSSGFTCHRMWLKFTITNRRVSGGHGIGSRRPLRCGIRLNGRHHGLARRQSCC